MLSDSVAYRILKPHCLSWNWKWDHPMLLTYSTGCLLSVHLKHLVHAIDLQELELFGCDRWLGAFFFQIIVCIWECIFTDETFLFQNFFVTHGYCLYYKLCMYFFQVRFSILLWKFRFLLFETVVKICNRNIQSKICIHLSVYWMKKKLNGLGLVTQPCKMGH